MPRPTVVTGPWTPLARSLLKDAIDQALAFPPIADPQSPTAEHLLVLLQRARAILREPSPPLSPVSSATTKQAS